MVFLEGEGGSCRGLMGENSSFQSLTTACDQKLSMLGRCGVDGMRASFLGETRPRGLSSGLAGGVANLVS